MNPFRTHVNVVGIDHIQLAMPAGQEDAARRFYVGLLGLTEVAKPSQLVARGGAWFENAHVRIHLGVDPEFRPAKKAHPGLLVGDLNGLLEILRTAGHPVSDGDVREEYEHAYVEDPFGNRIELIQQA
jgi:catechol 2,3-dioxygenase-like lactoylglutathione lyase family enzyme